MINNKTRSIREVALSLAAPLLLLLLLLLLSDDGLMLPIIYQTPNIKWTIRGERIVMLYSLVIGREYCDDLVRFLTLRLRLVGYE